MDKLESFKTDLRELLNNHNASIELMIEGDTHGIYDEGLGVSFLEPLKEGDRWAKWGKAEVLSNGYSIMSQDI